MKKSKQFAEEIINSGYPINSLNAIVNLSKALESFRKDGAVEFTLYFDTHGTYLESSDELNQLYDKFINENSD